MKTHKHTHDKNHVCTCGGKCSHGKEQKITRETKLNEILEKKPEVASVLFDIGLGCAGCHFSSHETLEEGCLGHGFNEEEIEEIVKMLNAEN